MSSVKELAAIQQVLAFMRGDWMDNTWSIDSRQFVPSLVLSIYLAAGRQELLDKKSASIQMNAEDIKTSRKYIYLLEERGLITFRTEPPDRRRDFIVPTIPLLKLVEKELSAIILAAQ